LPRRQSGCCLFAPVPSLYLVLVVISEERNINFIENEGRPFGTVWAPLPGKPES
jgi:hypothetical protein